LHETHKTTCENNARSWHKYEVCPESKDTSYIGR